MSKQYETTCGSCWNHSGYVNFLLIYFMSHFLKFLLTISLIWWALALSLLFRGEMGSLSSSILGPVTTVVPTTSVPRDTTPPKTSEPPSTTSEDASWYTWPWSSCVTGKRTRIVECRESSGTRVADSACPSPKPVEKEVYSIKWPDDVAFTEASWPATYQVNLIKPSVSDAKIISITATAEPKNTPAINYKHPADGSGKWIPWMTWTTQNIALDWQSAIIKTDDYAWYGTPDNDGNPPDNLPSAGYDEKISSQFRFEYPKLWSLSNSQSEYDIVSRVTLDNWCQLWDNFTMKVLFEKSIESKSVHRINIQNKKAVKTTLRPLVSLMYQTKIYRACVSARDVDLLTTTHEENNTKGQYKIPVMEEEVFHSRQWMWEVDWSQGWVPGLTDVLEDIFVDSIYCFDAIDPVIAEKRANMQLWSVINEVASYFEMDTVGSSNPSDKIRANITLISTCWQEKTAKEYAWSTPQRYWWHILEHSYPWCKQDMEQPESLVDIFKKNLDYFRGYVKK